MKNITKYINHSFQIWETSSSSLPVFGKLYSKDEKAIRESRYEKFQAELKELQTRKNATQIRKDPGKSLFPIFKSFLETVFDFEPEHLEIILSDDFKNVSKDFFYKAREFGPELKPENIYQGLRNVWIMNGLQLIMNIPVEITPSVFAYSMIYPYSDNYLDDPDISERDKLSFSERFDNRLRGIDVTPQNFTEEQLFKLVAMFEMQYPRNDFPGVYESLYAIQMGQTHSLELIGHPETSKEKIKTICFEKGGTSVLADGYLVAGKLTEQQEQALFGYGVYLQLLDDIQDIKEDKSDNTCTLFSFLGREELGESVNRSIHFGRKILEEMECFPRAADGDFLDLMNRSIEMMIIESAGLNNDRYSPQYLETLEHHSPLHFAFVREKRTKSRSQRFSLFQKYFEQSGQKESVD